MARIDSNFYLGDTKMEWINVDDSLPNGDWNCNHTHLTEEVLVANSAGIDIGYFNKHNGLWYVGEPAKENWIDKVTHWMPLPINPHEVIK